MKDLNIKQLSLVLSKQKVVVSYRNNSKHDPEKARHSDFCVASSTNNKPVTKARHGERLDGLYFYIVIDTVTVN